MADVAEYRFLPWTRRGLAAQLPAGGADLPARPAVTVGLTLTGGLEEEVDLTVYGPGDVLGVDTRLVVRTDPVAFASDVEPNYLPAVDFDLPDLPWMFTPVGAPESQRLAPWLVLVCVDADVVDSPRVEPGTPLPRITVDGADAEGELPDLRESWAWAHTQVVRDDAAGPVSGADLAAEPTLNVSRLVCPRRLRPGRTYHACLVPAFDAGVVRGLTGQAPEATTAGPAWDVTSPGTTTLPVYFHWTFSTGPTGDFEHLARRLRPFECPPTVGSATMHVGSAGAALPVVDFDAGGRLDMDGALRAPVADGGTLADVADDLVDGLAARVDAAAEHAAGQAGDTDPIGPPLYAGRHLDQHAIGAERSGVLAELNLDPRRRGAAAIGAAVVRHDQEELVQAAWEQVGEVLRANRTMALARLFEEVLARLRQRTILTMADDELFLFLAPQLDRMRLGDGTIRSGITATSMPDRLVDGALRRLMAPRQRLMRMAARTSGATTPRVGMATGMVATLAAGTTAVDPTHGHLPDGIVGIAGLDDLEVPEGVGTVDLAVLGLPVEVPAGPVRDALVSSSTAGTAVRPRDDLDTVGVVTSAQVMRLTEVGGARQLDGIDTLVQRLRDAVVEQPDVPAFRLTPDRGGVLEGIARRELGDLDLDALHHDVARPPRGRTPIDRPPIDRPPVDRPPVDRPPMDRPPVDGPDAPSPPTTTVPAPDTSPEVVTAMTTALQQAIEATTVVDRALDDSAQVVPFPLAEAATTLRAGTDPRAIVPRRLATRITVADRRVLDEVVAGDHLRVAPTHDRIWAAPRLPEPLYARLAAWDPDRFLPGVEVIPPNAITLVETNPEFIAAFLAGVNHEFNAELLWRGYPTDGRGTSLRHFWDWVDGKPDIAEIHTWEESLGDQARGAGEGNLVLLVRGDLLRRYPDAVMFAWRAVDGDPVEDPAPDDLRHPVFAGRFDPDFTFAGFELTDDHLEGDGWFFVIAEQPTEPRFGMDEPPPGAEPAPPLPTSSAALRWDHADVPPGGHLTIAGSRLENRTLDDHVFVADAAHLAAITLQKPFRVAVHSRHLAVE